MYDNAKCKMQKKKYVFDLYLKIKIKTKLIMLDYLNCKFERKKKYLGNTNHTIM